MAEPCTFPEIFLGLFSPAGYVVRAVLFTANCWKLKEQTGLACRGLEGGLWSRTESESQFSHWLSYRFLTIDSRLLISKMV